MLLTYQDSEGHNNDFVQQYFNLKQEGTKKIN